MSKPISVKSKNGFLGWKDLPHDCIFNKVRTGCGGTSIVLNNNQNYVIAVPTTELIINKLYPIFDLNNKMIEYSTNLEKIAGLSPVKNLFGLFGTFDSLLKSQLQEYVHQEDCVKKIMCTYDKLPYLKQYIEVKDYRLLIDEYHCLLKAYGYRVSAINGVFENFREFKSFCFMSATPIEQEFKPIVLEDVSEVYADWEDTLQIRTIPIKTNQVYQTMANIITYYKTDGYISITDSNGDTKQSKEAFIFINSVTDIMNIIKHTGLKDEEVRIICANNDNNKEKLKSFTISSSTETPRMFNFITSKAFEGVDFYSKTGLCFIVSNIHNDNTLLDISIDIPQIVGRIRNKENPFSNCLVHIFNTSKEQIDIDYEKVVTNNLGLLKSANDLANMYDTFSSDAKQLQRQELEKIGNSSYVIFDSNRDKFIVNDRLILYKLYEYKIKRVVYNSEKSLLTMYHKASIITSKTIWEYVKDSSFKKLKKKISFKEIFEKYVKLRSEASPDRIKIQDIECRYGFIESAYSKLGVERVRALKYVQSKIKEELLCTDTRLKEDDKICQLLSERLSMGTFYSTQDCISIIDEVYHILGYTIECITASKVMNWFKVKNDKAVNKRIEGKQVSGYIPITPLIFYKKED